ncbi:ferric-dicitrate binding protein FerR (iron transport regulator) [Algoriphagus sp. 4150]|uniref:FecR family protein n=1 Tax=Algoriphagus sp. 4150 TaxID=2817756 RepID=UPI00285CA2EA|nr:FecR domain-containing protein [Algoriphagus sp. 4150]MDR7129532.1 ferric-dicitrate binding protein FerR (iron transport regulator) [Algoriphagus sp. 4150]
MQITEELLKRYSEGHCTDEEVEAVEAWLLNSDSEEGVQYREEFSGAKSKIWLRLSSRFPQKDTAVIPLYKTIVRYAAVISILMAVGFVILNGQGISNPFAVQKSIAYGQGEQGLLTLKDHSTIQLNSGSHLQYSSGIGSKNREVSLLEGEAFFQITRDPKHPFIVHTDEVDITVLGTKFNIDNNPQTQEIVVTLIEGAIKFSVKGEDHILSPGQQVVYRRKTGDVQLLHDVNTERVSAWTKGILWFVATPMSEVFESLEQRYGVRFEIQRDIDLPFSAKFEKEPLDKILRLIEASTDLKFRKDKDHVFVY